jgi:hypothetical protein
VSPPAGHAAQCHRSQSDDCQEGDRNQGNLGAIIQRKPDAKLQPGQPQKDDCHHKKQYEINVFLHGFSGSNELALLA